MNRAALALIAVFLTAPRIVYAQSNLHRCSSTRSDSTALQNKTADRYTVLLSDTALGVQSDCGPVVAFNFPKTSPQFDAAGPRATYRDVFPNIDLVVYRNGMDFEYDWILRPGSDSAAVNLTFTGAEYKQISQNGELILGTARGQVRHGRPFAY